MSHPLKRWIASAGAAAILATGVLSAGAAHAADQDWSKVDPDGQKVSFWYQFSGPKQEAMETLIKQFNEENPWHITVTGSFQGNYGDIEKKMLPLLGSPAMPDMTVAYQNQANTYMQANAVLPLDSLVASKKWGLTKAEQDNFIPAVWKSDYSPLYGNQRLGMATQRSVQVMYYNKDWLKKLGASEPPKTMAEFEKLACAASKEGDGKIGFMMETDPSNMAGWTYSFGGDIFDGKTPEFTFTAPAVEKSMTYLQKLIKDGCAALQPRRYGDMAAFGQAKALFTVASSSSLTYYEKTVKDGANFSWAIAPMPYTTEKPIADVYGASFSVLNTGDAKRELAAFLFLKWLTADKPMSYWSEHSGYLPTTKSAAGTMADYFKSHPDYQVAYGLLDGNSEPAVPGYGRVRDEMEKAMAAIYGGAPVAATLKTLDQEANKELKAQLASIKK